jgi:DMSO/TMAO reductase YedYZ molybdopterin-dependent catalytic subunit
MSTLRDTTTPGAGLVRRGDSPPQYEATLDALAGGPITPVAAFYVRTHGETPALDPAAWRLALDGRVRHPRVLSLAELRALPAHRMAATLECAGNGRTFFHPAPPGVAWGPGAVGTAQWTGVRLGELLEAAGPMPDAAHVWFEAADRNAAGDPLFLRSIPLAMALDGVLLAYAMNDAPLTPEHGAPLRAIVPGWYAMASTKWVVRVRVENAPARNEFMAPGYHFIEERDGGTVATPIETMRIKSLIVTPRDGDRPPAGAVRVEGYAWGGRPAARVDVSADGGRTWTEAALGTPLGTHAWRPWSIELALPPGAHTLMSRATDAAGAVQPMQARPNAEGYGYNAVHPVRVTIAWGPDAAAGAPPSGACGVRPASRWRWGCSSRPRPGVPRCRPGPAPIRRSCSAG